MVRASLLSKAFGDLTAVGGINFHIEPGEIYGFLGPNGAGKTTTMKMIYAMVKPDSGVLEIDGIDVAKNPRQAKRAMGVVPQENNLDPELSVLQNLTVYARYYGIAKPHAIKRAHELLEFMQLTEKKDTIIWDLSGGMQRRLVLARGLIHDPKVLILDEPTTGLDPQARQMVWQKVRSLKREGITIILSTHYMEEAARMCDRISVMDHGKILETGSPTELIKALPGKDVVEAHADDPDAILLAGAYLGEGEVHGDGVFWFVDPGHVDLDPLLAAGALHVARRPANLEDVFLKLTGRELGE
jgi:lipooligosaccharide transport system ATP-binding protein